MKNSQVFQKVTNIFVTRFMMVPSVVANLSHIQTGKRKGVMGR